MLLRPNVQNPWPLLLHRITVLCNCLIGVGKRFSTVDLTNEVIIVIAIMIVVRTVPDCRQITGHLISCICTDHTQAAR